MVKAKTIYSIAQILVDNSAENGRSITTGLISCAVRNAAELFPDVDNDLLVEATSELLRRYKGRINRDRELHGI